MRIIRKIFQWFFQLVFLAVILFLAFWIRTKYVGNTTSHQSPAPAIQDQTVPLSNPKQANFQWQYNGASYSITETLYGSLYDFYKNSHKEYQYQGTLPDNWENNYYSMFLKQSGNDDSISKIADDIKNIGGQKKLNDDQMVELTLSFVQSIPYDNARAKEILSGKGSANYPYETLYTDTGVCSDKSFLLASLLKEMGYGTALLLYDNENHMAVGVQCPKVYSSYASGYCYAETTSVGFRIGMIPDIDPSKGSAVAIGQLNNFNQSELSQFDTQKLGDAKIIPESNGKEYQGIIKSFAVAKEIDSLRQTVSSSGKNLVAAKNNIASDESQLNDMKKKMDKLKSSGNYEEYNNQISSYNDLINKIKKEIKAYNQQVATYNQTVAKYNSLVKSF